MLLTLAAALALNYSDRMALGLVLQDIKREFILSDTELGLLTGIAFTLFYSVMGVPLARWADRGNRVGIIASTTALWGVAMAFCGFASTFFQLLLVRIAVAVGEAGLLPAAQSLISTEFDRSERPRALAKFHLGVPLSVVFGFFIAGWISEFYGWRYAFIALGAVAMPLSVLIWRALREPRLDSIGDRLEDNDGSEPSLLSAASTLWKIKTFRHLLVCWSLASFFGYGITQWKPAFFMRSFGLQIGEAGTWFAVIYGVGGFLGTYLGGELASRFAANDERRQLRAVAAAYCLFGAISAGIYLSPSLYLALFLMLISLIGFYMTYGPFFAVIQTLAPPHMRALSITVIYLLANLVGMGIGPIAAGLISDFLRPHFGEESLRYALLILCPGYVWAGWHLWCASKSVASDVGALPSERVARV